ncbi:hypothetical protein [Catelliglobosispora koreensis]|uniref:hypothetical protein n=1 Tax=Catelliglobosispora koreensis TaxID=129052 RepID=UPI0003732522|nr:hypothetical protein [Catelliglobosispora koreensis]
MSPARDEVITMLASYGDRTPEQVREKLDSLELAWLIHQVEQRYNAVLDLDDDQIVEMSTVDGAVSVLSKVLPQ